VGEIAHLASTSERGTGFQPVICDTHSQDGCAPLVSTGGAPLYQASILGDFQRRASSQIILKLAPFGTDQRVSWRFPAVFLRAVPIGSSTRSHRRFPTPTAFPSSSPRLRSPDRYLGTISHETFQPQRGCAPYAVLPSVPAGTALRFNRHSTHSQGRPHSIRPTLGWRP
jgi:hypothetical protein